MFLVCSSPVVAPCSRGATGAPPSQDSIPPRRLFLLSLRSVLNPSLSLSHAPRNRVSLTSVLNDTSSELDRKTSSSPDVDDAVELPPDVPPESTSDPRSKSDTSAMGSSPNASHSVTRRRLDRGSRL